MEQNPYKAPKEAAGQSKELLPYPWEWIFFCGMGLSVASRFAHVALANIAPPITTDPVLISAVCLCYAAFVAGVAAAIFGAIGKLIACLPRII